MAFDKYSRIAYESCGISGDIELTSVTALLCDFGDTVHFSLVPGMEQSIILRPQWIADVMAMVSIDMSNDCLSWAYHCSNASKPLLKHPVLAASA